MRNLTRALVALLSLAALAGCQVVTTDNPGEEEGGFGCLFDADRDGFGSFVGTDADGWTMDIREYEILDVDDCRSKVREGWLMGWLATDRIDPDDGDKCIIPSLNNGWRDICNDDDSIPADDDDATASDDDDSTASDDDDSTGDNNPNDWNHVLSLDWTMSGNSYARLLLGGNPPNLPFQIFANVVDRDHVNVDLYMNSDSYDQFEWLVLGFNDEARYQSWLNCANGDDPVNECWTLVDFESCTGNYAAGEAFPVGNHQARWQNSGRTVSFRANPYDGCIAVVN